MKSLYMKLERDISKYVILSGDPWRVDVLAKMLDKPKHIAFAREFNTYTGYYKGVEITVSSTGIGAPSAAIAMEEMYENGMEVVVRMGTVMALQDDYLGKFIIPIASMREESTSETYAPISYPAVADVELLNCMNQTVLQLGHEYSNGINCTKDGFYSQMKESKFSKEQNLNMQPTYDRLKKLNIIGIDMESSCILSLARLMNIKGCVVTMTTVLENLKEVLEGEARTKAEEDLCKVVLEGLYNYDKMICQRRI